MGILKTGDKVRKFRFVIISFYAEATKIAENPKPKSLRPQRPLREIKIFVFLRDLRSEKNTRIPPLE